MYRERHDSSSGFVARSKGACSQVHRDFDIVLGKLLIDAVSQTTTISTDTYGRSEQPNMKLPTHKNQGNEGSQGNSGINGEHRAPFLTRIEIPKH